MGGRSERWEGAGCEVLNEVLNEGGFGGNMPAATAGGDVGMEQMMSSGGLAAPSRPRRASRGRRAKDD